MSTTQLAEELDALPVNLREQAENFIAFLKTQAAQQHPSQKRQFGAYKGFFKMSDDFDEPLEDFKDYM
ncbi:MAG: type II toxin-antitoxin system VapB family antitoxin [Janthinobacterium lividum]